MEKMKLSPMALGCAMGILWAASLLLMGLIASFYAYGKPFVMAVGGLYLGYEPSILGSFIGAGIGFIDAFIGGALLAWLYNRCLGCVCKKS